MSELKIALIGSAPSSINVAPYHDPEWQIWGCSPGTYGVMPRCNAFFELHLWEPGQPWFSPEYVQWLTALPNRGVTLWVGNEAVKTPIPGANVLPHQEIIDEFDPQRWFCTSSLFWMMAMAIKAGAKKIGLWGVDMAACTAGDVKVLTADLRWVRADSLSVGDKLLAFDEEAQPNGDAVPQRRWRESTVLEASRLMKPCYKLTLEDGREIICSDDHKWLTHAENECRWKMTKDLVTPMHRPDRPTKIVRLTDVWAEDKSWEAGYLAAAFDGEGHLSQKLRDGANGVLRTGFAQRDNQMSELVIEAMQARGYEMSVDSSNVGTGGACRNYTIKGGRIENLRFLGSIRPRRLLAKFKPDDLGMMHKAGTVAVVAAEFIGNYPVIGLRTSTKTFVAEGLASHNTEEYQAQRSGIHHMAYIAKARGIEVGVPQESDLFTPRFQYGIDEWTHSFRKVRARRSELEHRRALAQQEASNKQQEAAFLSGAIDDLNYFGDTWVDKANYCGPTGVPKESK